MAEFVNVPEETDPDIIAQDIFEYLESRAAAWSPNDTELDTWLINAVSRILATLKDVASETRIGIFRFLGASIFELPPTEPATATASTTWTLTDTAGHTIPEGTLVGIPNAGGTLIPFETTAAIVVPVGKNKTGVGEVPVQAVEPGTEGNGLGAGGTVLTLESQYPWVANEGITLVSATSGGVDEEEDAAYLNRLVTEIRLWAPRPITPTNFSDMARNTPGVGRALALNLYNPETKTFGNEKTITIALQDPLGNPVSSKIKSEVKANLESKREVNMLIFIIDPEYTEIDVEFEVNHWEGFEVASIKTRCEEALAELFKPNTWGLPPFGDRLAWYSRTTVTINDVVAALGVVQGVKDVVFVKMKKHSEGTYLEAPLTLTGVATTTKLITQIGKVV